MTTARITTPLQGLAKACVLNSIATLFKDLPPEQIEGTLRGLGFTEGRGGGTPHLASVPALQALGAVVGRVVARNALGGVAGQLQAHLIANPASPYARAPQDSTLRRWSYEWHLTVKQFCKQFKTGCWYLLIDRHAMTVINGRPVDLYLGRPKMRAQVVVAVEILNARPLVQPTTARSAPQGRPDGAAGGQGQPAPPWHCRLPPLPGADCRAAGWAHRPGADPGTVPRQPHQHAAVPAA